MPPEVSFAVDGFVSYADRGNTVEQTLFDWRVDANNRITIVLDTSSSLTGTLRLTVVDAGSSVSVSAGVQLTPGPAAQFSLAFRVSAAEINLALDGTAETAVSNTAGVPDLSSADIVLGEQVQIGRAFGWNEDIGDTGLEEITA